MHTQTNDQNLSWIIHGIKYAIYQRISSGLTHDLVGPLSIALIQAGIIKRKLKADINPAGELLENAITVESHIKQTVLLIRAMKSWDVPNQHIFNAENAYKQCVKYFQTRLAMRSIDLILIENDQQLAAIHNFQAFLYCWLGLLCYLEDTLEMHNDIYIKPVEKNTLLIQFKEKQKSEIKLDQMEKPAERVQVETIGLYELQILNTYFSTTFEFNHNSILFSW